MRMTKNLGALERKSRRMRVTHHNRLADGGRLLTVFDPEAASVHQVTVHFGRDGRRTAVYAVCDCKWNRGDDGEIRGFGCAHAICALKTLGKDKRKVLHFYSDPDAARQQKRRLFVWYADAARVGGAHAKDDSERAARDTSADKRRAQPALYITSRAG
jgi:hypothetical protein